jgi:nicotinamidase-related amidase
MLFFDPLNIYLHPDDPKRRAAIDASGLIPRLVKINRACREAGIAIFYGQADHRPDGRDFAPHIVDLGRSGEEAPGPHPTLPPGVKGGTPGADIIPEIAAQPGDYVIKKHRWSTFFQTHFDLSLRTAGIDTIMLAGGAIEIGLGSTAYAARDLDYNQIFLRDVCTSSKPGVDTVFMEQVFPIFGRVMTVDEAIAAIER